MLRSPFGTDTVLSMRVIPARVAQASGMSATGGFAGQLEDAGKGLAKPNMHDVDWQA